MAKKVRIATFNCENLFARYTFPPDVTPTEISANGWEINQTLFAIHDPKTRAITAQAIRGVKADIIVLQEVENMDVLKMFRARHLGGYQAYPYAMLVDGNDPRFIDIAVLSKYPIVHVRSHQNRKTSPKARSYIFSRDCLEADILVGSQTITLFANHFKSMIGGRAQTRLRRQRQMLSVMEIVEERFGPQPGQNHFIILGDFNDYPIDDRSGKSSVWPLLNWGQAENVVARLPAEEQWTHYFKGKKQYTQLDYILVSYALSQAVRNVEIERRGLPRRADYYTGERFEGVGENYPKASDHCPVVVELRL